MTLRILFTIPAIVILLTTLALAGMAASHEWTGIGRGRIAIETAGRVRIVFAVEATLSSERFATNAVIGVTRPISEPLMTRLNQSRRDVDAAIRDLIAAFPPSTTRGTVADWEPEALIARLREARAAVDELLEKRRADRDIHALAAVMPRHLEAARLLVPIIVRADAEMIAAEPALAGIIAVKQLSLSLRLYLSEMAATWVPRLIAGEAPMPGEARMIRTSLANIAFLSAQLDLSLFVSEPTQAIKDAAKAYVIRERSANAMLTAWLDEARIGLDPAVPRQTMIALSEAMNAVRVATMDEILQRVESQQTGRSHHLTLVLVIIFVDLVIFFWSMFLIFWRLSGQLATIGLAIRRIAAGDRATPMVMKAVTRDLQEMVAAIETLRQTALVADATVNRAREAEQRRLESLHQALDFVQATREPARALEHGIARLCDGIDAAIALVTPPDASPSAALASAASAARLGLAELRGHSMDWDAPAGCPEQEIVARIHSLRTEVERREAAVRGLIQPSLAALRDVGGQQGRGEVEGLGDLISDQFERIEAAVASVASMRAAAAKAETILRDLSLEQPAIAA